MTTTQDGVKVVSLTHRPPLPAGNTLTTWCYNWFIYSVLYGHRVLNYVIVKFWKKKKQDVFMLFNECV